MTEQQYGYRMACHKLLKAGEELELIKKAQAGCLASRNKVVMSNQRLVAKVAIKFQGRGIELEDLISEGNTGLIHAVSKFDTASGFRLSTYAVPWIRERIQRAIMNCRATIRIPVGMQSHMAEIHAAMEKWMRDAGLYPSADELATQTGMPAAKVKRVLEAMDARAFSVDGVGDDTNFLDSLPADEDSDPLMADDAGRLLAGLPAVERYVIKARYGIGCQQATLTDLAAKMSVSRGTVANIHDRALQALKAAAGG